MPDNDKTIVMKSRSRESAGASPPITVRIRDKHGHEHAKIFSKPFLIGRDPSCDVHIRDDGVSRKHAEVILQGDVWKVRDLGSANGSFLDGKRIQEEILTRPAQLQLGTNGPVLWVEIKDSNDSHPAPEPGSSDVDIARRYVDPSYSGPMGDHTIMVRRAFRQATKKQSRRYLYVIGLVSTFLTGALGYAVFQQLQLEQLKELTVDIFYNMKELELQVARLETNDLIKGDSRQTAEISALHSQISEMESNYDSYLEKAGIFSQEMSEEDRLILHIARIFGECEVNLPRGFKKEVKSYIAKWQSSNRLASAVERARRNGYAKVVSDAMLQHYLPPQFFYLALQESDFKSQIVGPDTRYGIAKGIWQFIPETGRRYGLKPGPLLEVRSYDPRDDRFNFRAATRAAASYLHDIYTTEAQASGLLVMASYNWGENRIRKLIKQMPENPRERNFWALLKKHNIPDETYNYVYYIFSAAVIGENPRLFGFDFDNPLESPGTKMEGADGNHHPGPVISTLQPLPSPTNS